MDVRAVLIKGGQRLSELSSDYFSDGRMEGLRYWRRLIHGPLVAIGGLKLEHVPAARAAGADGIAVIADLMEAPDPEGSAKQWLGAVNAPGRGL